MRTPLSRIETVTGAFLVVVAALLAAALFASARRTSLADLFRPGFPVVALSEDAYGATAGSPVKVRDVEVGSVTDVTLLDDPEHAGKPVRINIQIRPSAARFLGDKTVAHIIRPPFGSGMPPFGTSSIELRSGGTGPLTSSAVLVAEGEDSMIGTFAKLAGDVASIREQFVAALTELRTTLTNVRTLTEGVVAGKGLLGRALNDDAAAESLMKMLHTAGDATEDLRRVASDMKTAAAQAPALAEGAATSSEELKKTIARVNQVLDSVPRIVETAERTLATAEELAGQLRTASAYAPELARKVDMSIEETNRLVEAAQKNFLIRGTMPDRPELRTESEVRPPAVALRDGGAP